MYENSPEYLKKFQKRFKYTICDTEPKPQDSGIENYAYGYHLSSTVIDGCSFGSNHWHLIFGILVNTIDGPQVISLRIFSCKSLSASMKG